MNADAIPYKTFKERIRITAEELDKGRYIEIWEDIKFIYSLDKRRKPRCTNYFSS